jgi:hypothetical protein
VSGDDAHFENRPLEFQRFGAIPHRFGKQRSLAVNPTWGYDRIQGALANVGYHISDSSVSNILKAHASGSVGQNSTELRNGNLRW